MYSAKAHVFQIDPATKRNWLPASKHAVTVSFFYDAGRSVYRIISVGGTKVGVGLRDRPLAAFFFFLPRASLSMVPRWAVSCAEEEVRGHFD